MSRPTPTIVSTPSAPAGIAPRSNPPNQLMSIQQAAVSNPGHSGVSAAPSLQTLTEGVRMNADRLTTVPTNISQAVQIDPNRWRRRGTSGAGSIPPSPNPRRSPNSLGPSSLARGRYRKLRPYWRWAMADQALRNIYPLLLPKTGRLAHVLSLLIPFGPRDEENPQPNHND
ncbi:hypothetical protein BS47DRAFT_1488712 [Hydnum rufescens UP504]|uniref:Uncharacterized protein n=1 Tax=Hydnum rufescens UP504 TaxID=1448309 RepID=A0A9P6DQQ6_9AGAM|nr:hypothetical protein BS47DRAFT_1488712 [Hydnum rufescens UP504]